MTRNGFPRIDSDQLTTWNGFLRFDSYRFTTQMAFHNLDWNRLTTQKSFQNYDSNQLTTQTAFQNFDSNWLKTKKNIDSNQLMTHSWGPDGRVVWGAGFPTCDRAGWWAGFPSPPGHGALPTTGASADSTNIVVALNGGDCWINVAMGGNWSWSWTARKCQ